MAKKGLKGLARTTGMTKDLMAGGGIDLGDFAAQFADFKKGLNHGGQVGGIYASFFC